MHLPVTVKEIQAGCLIILYFKDLYLYLAQNKLPSTKTAIHKVEMLAEKYILLDPLLFKLVTTPKKKQYYYPYLKYVPTRSLHYIILVYLQDTKV